MRLTFRTKLIAIVGATAFALVLFVVIGAVTAARVGGQLIAIKERYIPKVELAPQLEGQFDLLRRELQDAVAARDGDALDGTREIKKGLVDHIVAANQLIDAADAAALRSALDDYYGVAFDLSRRMIAGETGEELVDAMAAMQAKQARTLALLKKATSFERGELAQVFAATAEAQNAAGRLRLWLGVGCLLFVTLLSLWLSRGVLGAVGELTAGLARFGGGDFSKPIAVTSHDEFEDVAEGANRMAASLTHLGAERERTDWLKAGNAGLARELRGELEPAEVADRALRVIARHIDAPAAALYYSDRDPLLKLLGKYALSSDDVDPTVTFRIGEGLVGEAALREEITIINDPPADYLRIRSGLGEGAPRVIALLPIVHLGKIRGVVELALFKPWSEVFGELLLSVRETLAIALEVAVSRAAMRDLLAETQRQAERLRAQEEELQVNNEELHSQQEELRQTNEELGEQTQVLEQQRRTLEQRNSELDEARRGLERKAEELTKVSAYKSQFLANMSHELRTPLNSMLLLSSLLADNDAKTLSDKQVEFAKTINSAGKDLLALINQVLDLAKVESGKQQVRIEPVSLRELADNAERVFRPLASDKGLELSVELADGLPDAITTDLQRVLQIVTNLVANAIKFTERGRVTLRIAEPEPGIRFRRTDLVHASTVAFSVSDTGVGIAQEHQERIFVPFEQVDAASDRRYGGTGLGLSIARELSNLLGGELHLRSSLGKGSTFVCYLPYAHPSPTARSTTPGALVAVGSSVVRGRNGASNDGYLLIIEDDRVFGERLGEVIGEQGLEYVWARDGRTGLRQARERKPSGVILDVKLPDIDGFTIMQELRSDPDTADVPVHFLSAVDGAERGMAMGAVGYLAKPTSRNDLVNVVRSLAPRVNEPSYRILVVEDDAPTGESLVMQLTAENLDARRVASAGAALEAVGRERFACVILDLSLPDMDGLTLLRSLEERCGADMPAVVVYTARALSKVEATRLEQYAEAVVLKEGTSAERLVDEIRLFVRRLKEGLGPRRAAPQRALRTQIRLDGRKILIADDDMRTVYALSATLRAKGVEVFVADTGRAALDVLAEHPEIEAVLMDIMMPEMDGYEAMRRIRQNKSLKDLPIIALTAKAMKGDKEKCLEVGATDYLPKPIDPDALLTMLQGCLPRGGNGA